MMFGMAIEWMLILIVGGLGALVQWRLRAAFRKYGKVLSPGGLTGAQIAQKMLHDNGIFDVPVTCIDGQLTDHYDPARKTVNLSHDVYMTNSVSAPAVAAHECGHAVQHKTGYAPLRLRSLLVPAVNISSMVSQFVILIGIVLIHVFPLLFWIGITLFCAVLLFAVITLPVEFNASRRALAWLRTSKSLSGKELGMAKSALAWAASTYVIAALSSLATLIYYLGFSRRNT